MLSGRVVGIATATVKHPSMVGWKLLLVQPYAPDGRTPDGDPVLAVDGLGAGIGEEVVITSDGNGDARAVAERDDAGPLVGNRNRGPMNRRPR